jgi:ribosome-associated heat shock protein Hsp15
VTVALDRAVRVLKVLGFAERRGSADDARALCEVIEPAPGRLVARAEPPPALREVGAGRPTKRERRAIGRFTGEDES